MLGASPFALTFGYILGPASFVLAPRYMFGSSSFALILGCMYIMALLHFLYLSGIR